ncbi:MAG: helix-turn-helix transcriptional regulator [Actinobacteria bacterium]|nr:helix-turn-helix transcriptional regulator [Actinomycetota bacterium]
MAHHPLLSHQDLWRTGRARRHELGLSQEAVAVRCGVHWTFLGQTERGQRIISLHNILKLAKGLEINAGELVDGLEPPKV